MKKQIISVLLIISSFSLLFSRANPGNINPDFIKYMENNNHILSKTTQNYGTYVPPLIQTPYKDFGGLSKKSEESLPEKWEGPSSSIKNQGPQGACWAFASLGAIESKWMRNNGVEKDLSENNMLNGHGLFNRYEREGGNARIATVYLSQGKGPILEEDDPYQEAEQYIDLPPINWVSEARFFPGQSLYPEDELDQYITELKKIIKNKSPVFSTFFINGEYYDENDYTYFCPEGDSVANHAVTLVGWDDNIPTQADQNGAWIVKNSYGKEFGDEGYFYISYYDSTINSEVAYWPDTTKFDQDNFISAHDTLGWMGYGWGNPQKEGKVGHAVMKVSLSGAEISKVGTYSVTHSGSLEVTVYDDYDTVTKGITNGISFQNHNVLATASKKASYSGFYTLELDQPVYKQEDEVYIDIKYDFSNSNTKLSEYPIPIETVIEDPASGDTLVDPHISEGKYWVGESTSFMYSDSTLGSFDPCIKVYGEKIGGSEIVSNQPSSSEFKLAPNYPNPFNPTTTIRYNLPAGSQVQLSVYDIQGNLIKQLINTYKQAGVHEVEWTASKVASGVYFYRIKAGNYSEVKKCVLIK